MPKAYFWRAMTDLQSQWKFFGESKCVLKKLAIIYDFLRIVFPSQTFFTLHHHFALSISFKYSEIEKIFQSPKEIGIQNIRENWSLPTLDYFWHIVLIMPRYVPRVIIQLHLGTLPRHIPSWKMVSRYPSACAFGSTKAADFNYLAWTWKSHAF